jgi:hypothetical protein
VGKPFKEITVLLEALLPWVAEEAQEPTRTLLEPTVVLVAEEAHVGHLAQALVKLEELRLKLQDLATQVTEMRAEKDLFIQVRPYTLQAEAVALEELVKLIQVLEVLMVPEVLA